MAARDDGDVDRRGGLTAHAARVRLVVRGAVADGELCALRARAGVADDAAVAWSARLERHSLTWVTALDGERLVGFVNVAWDGGAHALLLDTVVDPDRRREGVGRALVRRAAVEAARAGCAWLHVDFEEGLAAFYLEGCGFRPTAAGLLSLRP